jgi:hypothetical protein
LISLFHYFITSDAEDPAAQSDGGSDDKQAIVDGRITFVALLKNVCGLNQREVSAITASGITSLLDMRRLKADWFDNMFVQIWKERHAKGPGHQNRMCHDTFRETQEQYLKTLWSEVKIRHETGRDIEDIRNVGVNPSHHFDIWEARQDG